MLQLLAQTTYDLTTTTQATNSSGLAALGIFSGIFLLISIPLIIFSIVCLWKVFEKAGQEGWKSIVPIYNIWVMCEIAGKPGWWSLIFLLMAIPLINFIAWIPAVIVQIIISIELAKRFGKEPIFAAVLLLLPFIGYAMLAFGAAKYSASNSGTAKPATPAKA